MTSETVDISDGSFISANDNFSNDGVFCQQSDVGNGAAVSQRQLSNRVNFSDLKYSPVKLTSSTQSSVNQSQDFQSHLSGLIRKSATCLTNGHGYFATNSEIVQCHHQASPVRSASTASAMVPFFTPPSSPDKKGEIDLTVGESDPSPLVDQSDGHKMNGNGMGSLEFVNRNGTVYSTSSVEAKELCEENMEMDSGSDEAVDLNEYWSNADHDYHQNWPTKVDHVPTSVSRSTSSSSLHLHLSSPSIASSDSNTKDTVAFSPKPLVSDVEVAASQRARLSSSSSSLSSSTADMDDSISTSSTSTLSPPPVLDMMEESNTNQDERRANSSPESRCCLCDCAISSLLKNGLTTAALRMMQLFAEKTATRICYDCIRPYLLWNESHYKWHLFVKRCDLRDGACRFAEGGTDCSSCSFWRKVDYVRDALGNSSSTVENQETSRSACARIKPITPRQSRDDEAGPSNADDSDTLAEQNRRCELTTARILEEEERLKNVRATPRTPRIKYVCRSEESVIGTRLPRALFEQKSCQFALSAMPSDEKDAYCAQFRSSSESDGDDDGVPRSAKKSSSKKRRHQKKGESSGRKQKRPKKGESKTPLKRNPRCNECAGCLTEECGKCRFCKDMKKNGGPGTLKRACVRRRCEKLAR